MCDYTKEVRQDLELLPTSSFITKWVLEHTPYIFCNNIMDYISWRELLAIEFGIDPSDIIVTGSACLGFSINPWKNFKEYDENSDIDVSIVSGYFFDTAWNELLQIERRRIPEKMKSALDEHKERLIYWGTIATDKILPLLSFGPSWHKIMLESRSYEVLDGRDINFRIYKDRRSVRNYVKNSVDVCKMRMLEANDK